MSHPVTTQPGGHFLAETHEWKHGLCSSLTDCPESACACCCCCWYVGVIAERAGENFWAGCCNAPIALLAVRSKVRGAFKIKGNLCFDQCISTCCCQCASMQVKKELDHHGIVSHGPTWLGNKTGGQR